MPFHFLFHLQCGLCLPRSDKTAESQHIQAEVKLKTTAGLLTQTELSLALEGHDSVMFLNVITNSYVTHSLLLCDCEVL